MASGFGRPIGELLSQLDDELKLRAEAEQPHGPQEDVGGMREQVRQRRALHALGGAPQRGSSTICTYFACTACGTWHYLFRVICSLLACFFVLLMCLASQGTPRPDS